MGHRILICDDSEFIRKILKTVLLEGGYEICGEASNGSEAIQKYRILKPDGVIMDIALPGVGGIAAVSEIRSSDPEAKIIMCSAKKELIYDAIQAGASSFITKPFKNNHVLEAVTKTLGDFEDLR